MQNLTIRHIYKISYQFFKAYFACFPYKFSKSANMNLIISLSHNIGMDSVVDPYPRRSALICILVPLRLQGSSASVVDFDPVGYRTFWPIRIPALFLNTKCDLFDKIIYLLFLKLYFLSSGPICL